MPCEFIYFVNYSGVETEHESAAEPQEVIVVEQEPGENVDLGTPAAVVNVVDVGSQEVLHQVHFTMAVDENTHEQQVKIYTLSDPNIIVSCKFFIRVFR